MSPLARLYPACGAVIAPNADRCRSCSRERERRRGTTTERGLGWHQRRREALVRSGDTTCWLCGLPGSWTDPDDPLTADHTTPRAHDGHGSDYRPAHRSCNGKRGAHFFAAISPDPVTRSPTSSRWANSSAPSQNTRPVSAFVRCRSLKFCHVHSRPARRLRPGIRRFASRRSSRERSLVDPFLEGGSP